jgi:hypothetical protein
MCTQSNRDRGLLSGWGEVKDGRLLDALVNVCDPYDVELVVVGESRDDDYGITYPRKPA